MTFNSLLGNDNDSDLSDNDRENIAERIDKILDEWNVDFQNEGGKREEIYSYLKVLLKFGESSKVGNSSGRRETKGVITKSHNVKSEMRGNRPVDDHDDAVFYFESKLSEKDDKIWCCKFISGKRPIRDE